MTLSDYLSTHESRSDFAKKIGVTAAAVNYWLSGERTPRPEQMQKIVKATGGYVQPNDFLPSEPEAAE